MRVFYIQQFFPGEGSSGSLQPFALVQALAERGHHVEVVAADYNIDSGELEPEVHVAVGRGALHVHRLKCPRGGRGGNWQRIRAYLHFMGMALLRGRRLGRPDVVVGSIQPMFVGLVGLKLAQRARAPFVLEIRDLWPDALVVKGAISGFQAKPLRGIVNKLYREAVRIVSLTPGIKTELVKKGVAERKIDVYPNGWNPKLFAADGPSREAVRRRYGWEDQCVAIYTGSFQEVTAVEVFVRAAARLKEDGGVRIVLFGAGPTLDRVKQLASELRTSNVDFHPPVPKKEVPGLLRAADAGLMALFRTPLAHIYFENKFMDYLGAALPIAAAMEGEQARLIRGTGCGRVVNSLDEEGLARVLLEMKAAPEFCRKMGQNGRRFVETNLQLPDILQQYAEMLEACAQGDGSSRPAWEPLR